MASTCAPASLFDHAILLAVPTPLSRHSPHALLISCRVFGVIAATEEKPHYFCSFCSSNRRHNKKIAHFKNTQTSVLVSQDRSLYGCCDPASHMSENLTDPHSHVSNENARIFLIPVLPLMKNLSNWVFNSLTIHPICDRDGIISTKARNLCRTAPAAHQAMSLSYTSHGSAFYCVVIIAPNSAIDKSEPDCLLSHRNVNVCGI